jgi:circadian clock protein KaiB
MMDNPTHDSTEKFEKALEELKHGKYVLRLYIAGNTHKSAQAIANIREICETHLEGRYELEVIDIYQQPELARGQQIIAAPTLIKALPLPLRRLVGDLSRSERILVGLDLQPVDGPPPTEEPPGTV